MQTSYTYDPFGNPSVSGAASGNRLQYTGLPNDGTGLQYNRARHYDPTLQRFISADPAGFGGGSLNLYSYVGNSPTNGTDPSGLSAPGVGSFGAGAPTLGGRKGVVADDLEADGGVSGGCGGPEVPDPSGALRDFAKSVGSWFRGLFGGSSSGEEPPPVSGGSGEEPSKGPAATMQPWIDRLRAMGFQVTRTQSTVWVVTGGLSEAEQVFSDFTAGGKVEGSQTFPGRRFIMPDNTSIGLRETSTSGPPTIDINPSGGGVNYEIKFIP